MAHKNIGYQAYLGMGSESVFRTAVVVDNKIPFLNESLIEEYERVESEWLDGHSGRKASDQGAKKVLGSFKANLVYDVLSAEKFVGTDLPLLLGMGNIYFDSTLANSQIKLSNDLNRFGTIALLKGDTASANYLWEFISAMCKGFTIEGDALKDIQATFDWLCHDVRRTACVNTATNLTGLPTKNPNRLLFGDMVFRIATDFTDKLAAADKLTISKFSLKHNNNLTDAEFGTSEPTTETGSITAFANAGGGVVTVTSSGHGLPNGARVVITGSTDYDGTYTISGRTASAYNITATWTVTRTGTWVRHTFANLTLLPQRNGFRDVTFSITVPRYTADTWLIAQGNKSAVQADVSIGNGTHNWYLYIPNMLVTKVSAPIGGPGVIPMDVEFKLLRGADYDQGAGNSKMKFQDNATLIIEEFAIETDNERAIAGAQPDGDG